MALRPPHHQGGLWVGTWNITPWSPESAVVISTDIAADILAVQETHLAALPLERARTTAHNLGLHLHHGRPVPRSGTSEHGKSCGVGFLAAKGVALSPVLPSGTAWRQLHATSRLHAVRVPPVLTFPRGCCCSHCMPPCLHNPQSVPASTWPCLKSPTSWICRPPPYSWGISMAPSAPLVTSNLPQAVTAPPVPS